jgi:hypothetical protein
LELYSSLGVLAVRAQGIGGARSGRASGGTPGKPGFCGFSGKNAPKMAMFMDHSFLSKKKPL